MDDGSSDRTVELLRNISASAEYQNTILNQMGKASALNFGIALRLICDLY
ncbi:hypothetical protein CS542_09205 [Pedobacter sp. IW39]|nr:hypothetical protein CS542_09205 [Pedobacter sp. IW39]